MMINIYSGLACSRLRIVGSAELRNCKHEDKTGGNGENFSNAFFFRV